MKHTLGQWETSVISEGFEWWIVEPGGGDKIAEVVDGPRAEANAKLIAAAPELLEMLINSLPYITDVLDDPEQLQCFKPGVVQKHHKAMRAAINLATGEEP